MATARDSLQGSFPGPALAGSCMVLAPLLLLAGAVLLYPFEAGTFEERQAELAEQSTRAMVGLELFMLGWMAAIVCVVAIAQLAVRRRPRLATVAGAWALAGVSVSLFFGGIATYELAESGVADRATVAEIEAGAEPPLVVLLSASGIAFGWLLLAFASFRAGVLGPIRSLALAATSALPVTVLGGFPMLMPLPFLGMAIALVPLGWSLVVRPRTPVTPAPASH